MRKKRTYTNKLTAKIEKGIEINELLSHEELSITVRNEAPALMDFLFPPEEMKKEKPELKNLEKIIEISLIPDKKQQEKYKLYQLSRNAANMFSSPSSKIQEKLREDKLKRYFKSLREFIFKDYSRNPMFAGHFQRMFVMALRNSGEDLLDKDFYNDKFNENFIPMIIKNSDLLPYRELLSSIMDEFTGYFPDCIDETLRYAAISTLHIDKSTEIDEFLNQSARNVYPTEDNKREEFIQITQPHNCKKQPLHIPYFINSKKFHYTSNSIPEEEEKEFIDKLKSDLKFDDLQLSDLTKSENLEQKKINSIWVNFALNLIYAFKNGYEMDTDNVIQSKVDQDEEKGEESNIIKCLLICGMYADSDSSLSYISFNLLFNLLNKPHPDSDDIYEDKYILNLNPPKIVDEYAEHFAFDPFEVSERMISALFVFWNHHYTGIEDDKEKLKIKELVPEYKLKKGVTPLQYLLPTILTEPICSSKLNNIFMRIIGSMEQEIIDTINNEKDYNENQKQGEFKNNEDRCLIFDSIWFDLLTYKFKLLPNDKEEITLQKALERLLPLPTTDDFYYTPPPQNGKPQVFRAPTNPVFFMLSNIINHGAFFTYKKGLQFRAFFTEPINRDWAFKSFEYYHIMDKMKKNLLDIKYPITSNKNKIDKNFPLKIKTGSDDDEKEEEEEEESN